MCVVWYRNWPRTKHDVGKWTGKECSGHLVKLLTLQFTKFCIFTFTPNCYNTLYKGVITLRSPVFQCLALHKYSRMQLDMTQLQSIYLHFAMVSKLLTLHLKLISYTFVAVTGWNSWMFHGIFLWWQILILDVTLCPGNVKVGVKGHKNTVFTHLFEQISHLS